MRFIWIEAHPWLGNPLLFGEAIWYKVFPYPSVIARRREKTICIVSGPDALCQDDWKALLLCWGVSGSAADSRGSWLQENTVNTLPICVLVIYHSSMRIIRSAAVRQWKEQIVSPMRLAVKGFGCDLQASYYYHHHQILRGSYTDVDWIYGLAILYTCCDARVSETTTTISGWSLYRRTADI